MKTIIHPGRIIKQDCLEPLGLTVTAAAAALGVTRPTLSRVINGRGAISAEMAVRLAKAFGSTAETWLRMQLTYDLRQIEKTTNAIKVQRIQHSIV